MEYRSIKNQGVVNFEVRADILSSEETHIIRGKAITFNSWSKDLGGFYEIIHPEAISEEFLRMLNVYICPNHKADLACGRYNKGVGDLKLWRDDEGVYFELDCDMNFTYSKDLYIGVKNHTYEQCSFCFTLPDNDTCQVWSKDKDGMLYRDIYEIEAIYDVSCVTNPAYEDTWCEARNIELSKISNDIDMALKDKENLEVRSEEVENDEVQKDEERNEENENVETPKEDENEEKEIDNEDEKEERNDEESTSKEDEVEEKDEDVKDEEKEEKEDEEKEDEENRQINKETIKRNLNKKMEKRFSLVKTILDVAENRSMDEVASAVINGAKAEMRNANLAMNGQIQLPSFNERAYDVATEGADLVEVKIQGVLEPLRAKNIAAQLGAKTLFGLTSDIQVPVMGKTSCAWASETGNAGDGSGAFTSVKLSPKRITCFVDLSKLLLYQASSDVEALVYNDIANALNAKIEETIFGVAKVANAPVPMAWDKTTDALRTDIANVTNFKGLTDLEANIEKAGVFGELKYAISPAAKSVLRNMVMSGKTTRLVLENQEIDGTTAISSGHLTDTDYNVVYGDWSNLCIAQFGNVDIVIDPYTKAGNGQVRLVLNAYVDFAVLRPEAFGFAKV